MSESDSKKYVMKARLGASDVENPQLKASLAMTGVKKKVFISELKTDCVRYDEDQEFARRFTLEEAIEAKRLVEQCVADDVEFEIEKVQNEEQSSEIIT